MSTNHIITGNLGSGKTEFAINLAIKESLSNKKTALIDIDIVNPYFCSREYIEMLTSLYNITVIAPNPQLNNAELMILPSNIIASLNSNFDSIIIDVGGNFDGIKALIQFNNILKTNYKMYYIFNTARPQTKNYHNAISQIKSFENLCNMKITDIVSNTHYGTNTKITDIIYGDSQSNLLSKALNISYSYLLCLKEFTPLLENLITNNIFEIDRKIKFPWD